MDTDGLALEGPALAFGMLVTAAVVNLAVLAMGVAIGLLMGR